MDRKTLIQCTAAIVVTMLLGIFAIVGELSMCREALVKSQMH